MRTHGKIAVRARASGFTLVELLVALLSVAVIVGGVWAFHSMGTRQVQSSQAKLDSLRAAHYLFEILHRDLASATHVVVLPGPGALLRGPGASPATGSTEGRAGPGSLADAAASGNAATGAAPGSPGAAARVFFIDGKEFVFDPATRSMTVAGRKWSLGLYQDVQLTVGEAGLVHLRVVSVPDPFLGRGVQHGGTTIEGDVTVLPMRDAEHNPYTVQESRGKHMYCLGGPPVDY